MGNTEQLEQNLANARLNLLWAQKNLSDVRIHTATWGRLRDVKGYENLVCWHIDKVWDAQEDLKFARRRHFS